MSLPKRSRSAQQRPLFLWISLWTLWPKMDVSVMVSTCSLNDMYIYELECVQKFCALFAHVRSARRGEQIQYQLDPNSWFQCSKDCSWLRDTEGRISFIAALKSENRNGRNCTGRTIWRAVIPQYLLKMFSERACLQNWGQFKMGHALKENQVKNIFLRQLMSLSKKLLARIYNSTSFFLIVLTRPPTSRIGSIAAAWQRAFRSLPE